MEHPFTVLLKEHCPMTPCTFVMGSCDEMGFIICDVNVVEAMYTTKNKYFDKHDMVYQMTYPLLGDSILLSPTTTEWKTSRKALAPSFYKGKLVQMIELAKVSMRHTLKAFKKLASAGPQTSVDIVSLTSMMTSRILLMCALGEDVSERQLDYWKGGKLEKQSVAFILRQTFAGLIKRMTYPHVFFIGF